MAKRLRILDLCCCAGGAGVGYNRAGFEVVGIDIANKLNYPFPFHQGNALSTLEYMLENTRDNEIWTKARRGNELDGWWSLDDFDAIHGSPICQDSCTLSTGTNGLSYTQMIPRMRELFIATGKPYVIENVPNAPLRPDLTLCGEMFGLRVIRHRIFEMNFPVPQPEHIEHQGRVKGIRHGTRHDGYYFGVHGHGGGKGTLAEWKEAMGIDWKMTKVEVAEAIPPAYTQYIGQHLWSQLQTREAA